MNGNKPYPYAYIRGTVVPIEQATVSVMTNALHYGAGIFGGLKAYQLANGVGIFRLNDHIRRLQNSCRILRFPYELPSEQFADVVTKLIVANRPTVTAYIRPLIYRADTDIAPGIDGQYDLAVYLLPMTEFVSPERGMDVCISSWYRNADNALPPRTKATGGYLNSSLAIHDAKVAGYDSAILLDSAGMVGEGAVMNLFMVKDGRLVTPGVENDILEGVTRRTIIELARERGMPFQERPINRTELYTADELFFCGTAVELTWCHSVDRVVISQQRGLITTQLYEAWRGLPHTHPKLYTVINQ